VGVATLGYALASLAHHVHNAEWLDAYPNLPAGLTRAVVYAHYAVAPVAAHSLAMNLTIGCEVATATLLALCVACEARRQFRVNEASGT
jgi:hypothetical protein